MSVAAIVEDGVITNATSITSSTSASNGSSLNKDDFLQLLVAQMKYQDPLEPTSNTEYIAQYATFSQVEQMQNMSQSMDLSRASTLVGKTVQVTSISENGRETTVMGKVDYVKYENGKALVSIDESLYSLDDVTFICDEAYLTAYGLAEDLLSNLADLPQLDDVTINDKEAVTEVIEAYDKMDDYQKTFVAEQVKKTIELYREKMEELVKKAEETVNTDGDGESNEESNDESNNDESTGTV